MLKNRIESLEQTVKQHYKKQNVHMKEALGNLDKRKKSLLKLDEKVKEYLSQNLTTGALQSKIEWLEDEFIKINRSYDCPFHNFKHCQVTINPQNAGHIFESIGAVKNPIVASTSSNTYQYFNLKHKPLKKSFFFGDSNHTDMILIYDFEKDRWSWREVPSNLAL